MDEAPAPAETPERSRHRWIALMVLAACCGLSGYLFTGDSRKATAVAALVAVVFVLLLTVVPKGVDRRRSPAYFYLVGLGVLVAPLVMLKTGSNRTPWNDLQHLYRATGPPPAGMDGGHEVVLVEPVDELLVKPYSFKRATVSFTDAGVYLGLARPMSLVYDPLWVPLTAISACAPSGLDTMYTSLALRGHPAKIEVVDASEDVLRWCRKHGIGTGQAPEPEGLSD
jgi:hypothetical protein